MTQQEVINLVLENSPYGIIAIILLLIGIRIGRSGAKKPVQECPLPQDVLLRLTMSKIQEAITKTDHKLFLDVCSKAYDNFHTLKQASEELSSKK